MYSRVLMSTTAIAWLRLGAKLTVQRRALNIRQWYTTLKLGVDCSYLEHF